MILPTALQFAEPIVEAIEWAIMIFSVVIEVLAFVHCVLQRTEAFRAVGTLSKGFWLALTGGPALLTVILFLSSSGENRGPGIIALIGITAAAVYLLDVRPGIRGLSDGLGGW